MYKLQGSALLPSLSFMRKERREESRRQQGVPFGPVSAPRLPVHHPTDNEP